MFLTMAFLSTLFDLFLHIDQHLITVIAAYGVWVYILLFIIVFLETGIVVTPFLPGDSLLFAAGALASQHLMNIGLLLFLFTMAAILGDTLNYAIGRALGRTLLRNKEKWLIKGEYYNRTVSFYAKHGGKTILLARFVPVIRTFAPFVAGIAKMRYSRFAFYNIAGGILWVGIFTIGGFLFGNIPFVQENFSLALLIIITISFLPFIIEIIKQYLAKKKQSLPYKKAVLMSLVS